MTTEKVDVAIIGAGQAGLSTSYFLKQAGIDHVVLDAGRVAETWRSRRWDSFCLVTPNWSVQLPGGRYSGPDPDGFIPRNELVDHIQGWADGFGAPVREHCTVTSLAAANGGFVLETGAAAIEARRVVVASGGYQKAHLPAGTREFPETVTQLLAEDYRNPDRLAPGGVLIIGSGQTGCQLAEELHNAGRKVVLACGRSPWAPRRFGGHDIVWWICESGWGDRTVANLSSPAARLFANPQATGRGGGHDLHYRTLHAMGVEMVDRFLGAQDGKVYFGPDLSATIAGGDVLAAAFNKWVDAYCARSGLTIGWEMPPPLVIDARTEVDLEREGISTVIWTSGYRPDYAWVHIPVFDDMGFPVQTDGRSAVDGLYFMGVHFLRRQRSAVLYGVAEDAEVVAKHIIENRQ